MYRWTIPGQFRLDIPFGVELSTENRWVKLAGIMPWEAIEERYSTNFAGVNGQVAKSGRLAFAALYIQGRLDLTDEETVNQIQENPSMQYFCGFESYTTEKPFDTSLLVYFRKRLTPEIMQEIAKAAFAAEAKKAIDKERSGKDGGGGPGTGESGCGETSKSAKGNPKGIVSKDTIENERSDKDCDGGAGTGDSGYGETTKSAEGTRGTMLLDATCCPSDIHYPTDIGLLNHARELTEQIIDELHEQLAKPGYEKPRTYRIVARKAYLGYAKKRKHTKEQLRKAIRQQLQFVRRNLDTIDSQVGQGAKLEDISNDLQKKHRVITELYHQQKEMHDKDTHTVEDRIVSISQPHLRPIVRGKTNAPVEFGAKVTTAHIGGFSFIIHMSYDNFSEAKYLEAAAEEYKGIFGFYPEKIIGDKAYGTRENRDYCKSKGIRLSGPRLGRKTDEAKEEERKQIHQDGRKRNAIEGGYGTAKRKYGLGLIMAKLAETAKTEIAFGFFVKNMERLRLILSAKPG